MSKKQSSQKITALYARLSRDDENEDVSGSIKNQRALFQAFGLGQSLHSTHLLLIERKFGYE